MRMFQSAISDRHSFLPDVYAVVDGLKLYLEQVGDTVIQPNFYNGWVHGHYVGNVFVFAPNGTIIACAINCPGTMHDSQICDFGGIYDRLEDFYNASGGRVVVYSVLCRADFPFLTKSAQDETHEEGPMECLQLKQATSVRQASEWGMCSFQGSFPRMRDRFPYEENRRTKSFSLDYSAFIQSSLSSCWVKPDLVGLHAPL